MRHETFMDRVLSGQITDPKDEIDDYVDEWHESTSALPLHEYLGLTQQEYELWVHDRETLTETIEARGGRGEA